jgi:molecular chaperone DnaJ
LCPQCGGRGVIDDNQGLFSFSTPCRRCGGAGTVIEDPCPTCRGSGVEKRAREVQARIPPGVSDGQTIRLKGRGAPGRNGGPAGDLLVDIHVSKHPRFGRSGNNLTTRVPVSFADAALGADISVPTLDGPDVKLRLRPGTQPGSRHRVKGRGIKTSTATGDLIVTVDLVVPTTLSDAERAAIEQLAEATTVSTTETA